MATLVFTNAYLTVNAVDLSDHVKSATLKYEAELHDATTMSSVGTRINTPGLKNWGLEVEFLQDYASGSVDATLFALIGAAAFAIALRPVNGAISTTNPEYQGNAVLESYPPVAADVGALGSLTASFRCASALTRDTTP